MDPRAFYIQLFLHLFFPIAAIGENIVLTPISARSHVGFFGRLAAGLAGQGHQVTLLVVDSDKISVPSFVERSGVNIIKYEGAKVPFTDSKEANELLVRMALSTTSWITQVREILDLFQKSQKQLGEDCDGLVYDQPLFEQLKKYNFTFGIVDNALGACYHAYMYKLGIPYGSFSVPMASNFYRVPSLASQTAVTSMPSFTDESMSFFARLKNFFLHLSEYYIVLSFASAGKDYVKEIAPEKPHLSGQSLMQNSKLWLYLYDPVLGHIMPSMPNTLNIADIMCREAEQLPSHLNQIVSRAQHGVIIVSFGSLLSAMPEEISKIIFKGFSKLEQTVIMKKPGELPSDVGSNIHLFDWIPQNDLLAQKNVKLFVSHCGFNSLIETVYNAVPMLATPLLGDQYQNADTVVRKGIGEKLQMGAFSAEELSNRIQEMVNNNKYSDNVVRLSKVFRDKQHSAAARASHLINHVIKHGDAHLRTKAFDLSLFQFMMLDIYIFLLLNFVLGIVLTTVVARVCFRCVYARICRSRVQKVKTQ